MSTKAFDKSAEKTYPHRELGHAIHRARTAKGLTQAELGARTGLSDSYIAHVESGRRHPKPKPLRDIARVLEVSYDELSALAGYREPVRGDDPLPVPQGYRGIVLRLIDRYTPDELTAWERALTSFFLDIRSRDAADREGESQRSDNGPQPQANG